MTDYGTAVSVTPLLTPGVAGVMGTTIVGGLQGTARSAGALLVPWKPVGAYSLAGTYTPPPCPDCPDCPDCPELPVGIVWAPGGRFGQERP